MSILMKNPTPEINTVKFSCQEGGIHYWGTGKEEWVWTERVNNGCSVIVFLSPQACFFYHAGQLPPAGYHLWEAVDSASRIESAWTIHYTMQIIDQFRAFKSQLQDGELYIVCPGTPTSATNPDLRISDSLDRMQQSLKNETGINPKTIEYTPTKISDLEENSRKWMVVEARSLESGGKELYVNGALQNAQR